MKLRAFLFSSFVFVLLLASLQPPVSAATTGWEVIVPGVDYEQFHLPTPNNVFVARLDLNDPAAQDVIVESSIGQGRLSGGVETVAGQAARYDEALNNWGGAWGGRNQVVVAINGYYFDSSGVPYQGQIQSGWYAKRFDDCETGSGGSGFAWKLDRSLLIGASISHPASKQIITYVSSGVTQEFDGINIPRGDGDLIVYTPQYDTDTLTDNSGAEVLVEMSQPDIIPDPGEMMTGTVEAIRDGKGSTSLPFDHIVLSASGKAANTLLANVQVGDVIGISHKIKSYESDCASGATGPDWRQAYASIGGAFYYLNDGAIRDFSDDPGAAARAPRTSIAYNGDYLYFVVVDGRDPARSVGMTIGELADFVKNTLGASYGIAQDGGGSSTMWVNGVVKNNTFCNNVFCKGMFYLPLITRQGVRFQSQDQALGEGVEASAPTYRVAPSLDAQFEPPGTVPIMEGTQRMVANGMMMVVVEPMERSSTYTTGVAVVTSEAANVRLGPGTNYAILETVPAGSDGTIADSANNLNGVLAKESYWWKVDFGDTIGWVPEQLLAPETQ